MDLVEIRKKARQQSSDAEKPLTDRSPTGTGEDSETALNTDIRLPARVQPAERAVSLQQFFPDHQFATEEEYIQGLSGRDRSAEMDLSRWLTFMLGGEEYALSLDVVLELIKPRTLTDLPGVPDYLRGILSLRGEVVPVLDLGMRLNIGAGEKDSYQRIVICAGQEQSVGLLVDRIVQVVQMSKAAIEPAPLILHNLDNDFVTGVSRYQGRMLILLNPDEILKI